MRSFLIEPSESKDTIPTNDRAETASFGWVSRQATIRFSGLAFDKVLGYVFALFVTKTYGPGVFGLYLFGMGLVEIMLALSKLGIDRASVRAVATLSAEGKLVEIKGIVRTALALTLPLGSLLAIAVLIFDQPIADALDRPDLAVFLRFIAIAVPVSIFTDGFFWATEGLGRQRYMTIVRLVCEPIIKTAIAIFLFLMLGDSAGAGSLGLAYTISILVGAALSFAIYRRVIAARMPGRAVERHSSELLRVGLPLWGLTILNRLFARADIFIIFTYVSSAATAHYGIAQRTALLTTMIEMAFNAAFRPAIAYTLASERRDELKAQFLRISRTALTICLPLMLGLLLFPSRVMAVVGDQFMAAAPVVALVTVGTFASFTVGPVASALAMAGLTRIQFVNGVIAGLLGLALNIALIPKMGIIGAGIAYGASAVLLNALNARSARRLLGVIGIGRDHLPLLMATLLAAGAGFLADAFAPANKYAALAMISISLGVAYIAALAVAGIAEEDRRMMRNLLARIRATLKLT